MLSFAAFFGAKDLLYVLLFSALHELGHLLMLVLFKGSADSLKFSYYGLALKYESRLSAVKEFFVIFAGPAVNIALYSILRDDINLLLFFVNILPVYPLDGGRMLRLFSVRISKAVSSITLIAVYILSFYLLFRFHSFSLILIAVYLTVFSINC